MSSTPDTTKKENSFFLHVLQHQKKYLTLLLLFMNTVPFLSNFYEDKPMLIGGESYYYLSSAQQGFYNHPLAILAAVIPDSVIFLLPPIISLITLFLFFYLAKKLHLSETITFFIGLFFILSPAFIFNSITLSSSLFFGFLLLAGFSLFMQDTQKRYLSLLPFAAAAFFDTFSTAVLIIILVAYVALTKKLKDAFCLLAIGIITALLLTNKLLLDFPIILGPFHVQKVIPDLVSDLGGLAGVGFFTLLLAIIGTIALWKKKIFLLSLPLLALFIAAYLLNTHTIFFLSIFIICFAAAGFASLCEQQWALPFLKRATIFLLILGVAFSAVSYLSRVTEYPPSSIDHEFLTWMERNTPKGGVALSAPENSYYIQYFAERKPVFDLQHDNYRQQLNLSQEIFSAIYVQDLFPLLEAHDVSIIYITKSMKENLPEDRGFIFLLQNERFKLLRSSGDTQVWLFNEAEE